MILYSKPGASSTRSKRRTLDDDTKMCVWTDNPTAPYTLVWGLVAVRGFVGVRDSSLVNVSMFRGNGLRSRALS